MTRQAPLAGLMTRQAPTGGLDDDKAGPHALAGMMTIRQAPTGRLLGKAGYGAATRACKDHLYTTGDGGATPNPSHR